MPTPAGQAFRKTVTEAMLLEVIASFDTLLALLAHLLNALAAGARQGRACDAVLWQHTLNALARMLPHAGKSTVQPFTVALLLQAVFAALASEYVSDDTILPDSTALRGRVHALLVL